MDIEHLSVSRHGTWKECRQRYKYRYLLKAPISQPEQPYFLYGKCIHKCAEIYVKSQGKQSLKEISEAVFSGKILVEENQVKPPDLPTEYKRRIPESIRAIDSLSKKIGFDGDLEYPFDLDLDPPNKKILSGVIDRLIRRNDKYFIIDYKTTKRGRYRKDPYTVRHDLQLRAYTWAVQKIFKISADNIKSALYYFEGSNLVCAQFSQRSIDAAVNELREVYDEILNIDPYKIVGSPGHWCNRCDYRDICPYKRN